MNQVGESLSQALPGWAAVWEGMGPFPLPVSTVGLFVALLVLFLAISRKGEVKRDSKNEVTFSPRGVPGLSGLGTEGNKSHFHMKSSPKFLFKKMCFKKQMRHQRPKARQMQSGKTDILKTSLL